MKKLLTILTFLFLLSTFGAAAPEGSVSDLVGDLTSSSFELFSSWQALSVALLLLSAVLISIAYAIGHAFEFHDLKAWSQIEIVQVIASALLLLCFVAFLGFFDAMFMSLVNSSSTTYSCAPGNVKGCSAQIADQYIDGLIELGRDSSGANLQTAYDHSFVMGQRYGFTGHTLIWLPFLWLSFSMTREAHLTLDVERLQLVTEFYGPILSSLYAQKFFVSHISHNVGPYLLVLGLLTRSFFATRKLGGLLIAIAVGVMFVFPIMYVFNALTLSVTAYGDAPQGGGGVQVCPQECTDEIPVGYYVDGEDEVMSDKARLELVDDSTGESVFDVLLTGSSATVDGDAIAGCGWPDVNDPNDVGCPTQCRGEPYPELAHQCQGSGIKQTCDALPAVCKRDLILEPSTLEGVYLDQYNRCPNECKTIPPLKEDCTSIWKYSKCISNSECGVDYWDTQSKATTKTLNYCKDKFTEVTGLENPVGISNSYCGGQSDGSDWTWKENEYCSGSSGACTESLHMKCCYVSSSGDPCSLTSPECKARYYEIDSSGNKVLTNEYPPGCNSEQIARAKTCDAPSNTELNGPEPEKNTCIYLIPKDTENCAQCMFVSDVFTFSPPVVNDCSSICGAEMGQPPEISTSNFATMSSEGMYGKEDIKSVSGFMLPAYLLPLFNLLVTIMFIKTFSPLLGGDIEIPGLSKVF